MLWQNFTTSKQNRKLYKKRFQLLKSTFVHPNQTYPYRCQTDTKCHQEHQQRNVMDHLKPEGSAEVTEERPFKKESTKNIWRNVRSNKTTWQSASESLSETLADSCTKTLGMNHMIYTSGLVTNTKTDWTGLFNNTIARIPSHLVAETWSNSRIKIKHGITRLKTGVSRTTISSGFVTLYIPISII